MQCECMESLMRAAIVRTNNSNNVYYVKMKKLNRKYDQRTRPQLIYTTKWKWSIRIFLASWFDGPRLRQWWIPNNILKNRFKKNTKNTFFSFTFTQIHHHIHVKHISKLLCAAPCFEINIKYKLNGNKRIWIEDDEDSGGGCDFFFVEDFERYTTILVLARRKMFLRDLYLIVLLPFFFSLPNG